MDTARKMTQARSNLILEEAFFGTLSTRLELIPDASKKTMCTNGKWIKYNPAYVDKLTLAEVAGDICHEVLHVANGHCWREGGRDHNDWNEACDFAINPIVKESGLTLPENPPVLLDPQYAGMAAEQIYSRRREMKQQQQQSEQQQQGGQGQSEKSQSSGSEEQEENEEQSEEQSEQKSPDEQQDESNEQDEQEQQQGEDTDESTDDSSESEAEDYSGCGEVEQCTDDDIETQEAEWQVATMQAAQAAKARGQLPGSLEHMIEKLKAPRVDWKAALLRFMQQTASADYTWTRPNRHYLPMGIYLPDLRSEAMPPLVIGWDTSMSTYAEQDEFAAEVSSAIAETRPELTHVVYCDSAVQRVDEFTADDEINFNPPGGGGTKFAPVFEWVKAQDFEPACLIYFTDLEGEIPVDPGYPVLWVSTGDPKRDAPWGETIHLRAEGRAS